MTRGREYRASSYEDQLLHWRTHARPSRWPRLLAALSYAEKLVSAATPQTRTAHVSRVWRWSATTWRRSSGWSSPRSRDTCSAPRCVTWKVWCRRRQLIESTCLTPLPNVTTFICRQALHHRRGAVQAGWPVRRGGGQVARCLLQCYLSYPCVTYHRWKDYFPSLRHCRVAHGAVASGDTIYVTGGSAKANANFGPGWYYLVPIFPAC